MKTCSIFFHRTIACFLLACLIVLPGLPAGADEEASQTIFAMDTVMTLQAEGPGAADVIASAVQEIQRLDNMLSAENPEGPVGILNAGGRTEATEEIRTLLEYSQKLWEENDGAFDIAVYPAMRLWGFPTQEYRVPGPEELEAVRPLADMSQILLDEETGEVSFGREGMAVDFGAIAKGYASARIRDLFEEEGMTRGLVNLGGNVQSFGTKEGGKPWRIAIRDPWKTDSYLGVLEIGETAVITSGDYERYFEQDGVRYHHILDPATLSPARSGLTSVSVVCPDGTLADGLSTSLFILGLEKGIQCWEDHQGEFEVIWVTEDGTVHITEGLKDSFTTDYPCQVVSPS